MKRFNKKYISLKGLDKNISEHLENLSGKEINECCGCDCKCCEPTCCDSTFIYLYPHVVLFYFYHQLSLLHCS